MTSWLRAERETERMNAFIGPILSASLPTSVRPRADMKLFRATGAARAVEDNVGSKCCAYSAWKYRGEGYPL